MTARIPPSELTAAVRDELDGLRRESKDPQRFDGSMYLRIYEKIVALFAGLNDTVTNLVQQLTYTRNQIDQQQQIQDTALATAQFDTSRLTTGTLQPVRGGTGTANAYNNDLSAVTRRTAWVSDGGVMGYAPSTRSMKQDIRPADFSLETLRKIEVVLYRYKWPVLLEGTSVVAPGFKAATEIGALAEDLHEAGLWPFVVYEGRGDGAVPVGIHVELLGLAGIMLGQRAHTRLDEIEQRLKQNGIN